MIEPGKVGARVNQFNLLRTIEDMYALAPTGKAAQATPITEVFGSGGLVEPFVKAVLRARPHSRGDHVSLSGRVLDAGGKGLSGWWVYLDANRSGDLEPGDPIVRTRRRGHFSFRGLVAGTYDVRVVPQAQYVPPSPDGGALRLTIGPQEHVTGIQFSEHAIFSSGTAATRP